jgi:hypothetical protein
METQRPGDSLIHTITAVESRYGPAFDLYKSLLMCINQYQMEAYVGTGGIAPCIMYVCEL